MRAKNSWCTMKILVLSDSHVALSFMRLCIEKIKPDHIVHLGDHYEDGRAMAEQYPHIRFHQVPGNCDRYRCDPRQADILCYDIAGVRIYMTHGHRHGVKSGDHLLVAQARSGHAQIALYGHTHQAICYQMEDGMWVLNPGSCGSYGGSVGVIEIENKEISSCSILRQEELELGQDQQKQKNCSQP